MNLAIGRVQRLAELRMIPVSERSRRCLMVLIAKPHNGFFDESGTHDQSDLVVVGGLLASYESWARAELEWDQILKSKSLTIPFHFTDFMARQPPWDWLDAERDDFMERLTTVIGENVTLGIAMGVFKEDYATFPKELRREFKDIYHCCSYFCFDALVKWKTNFTGPSLPTPVQFLFDRKPKFEGHAAAIYYKVVKDVDPYGMLGEMGFGSKNEDKPLQMADLFVGASARHCKRKRQLSSAVDYEKSMARMNRQGRMMPLCLRKEDLKQIMDALRSNRPKK